MKKKVLFLICIVLFSLTGCGSKNLSSKDIVGTWILEVKENSGYTSRYNMDKLMLYEGGTGKGISKNEDEENPHTWYPLTWEIKDGILNIKPSTLSYEGYKMESKKLVTVDGKYTYTKK